MDMIIVLLALLFVLGLAVLWARISMIRDALEKDMQYIRNKEDGESLVWKLREIDKEYKYEYVYPGVIRRGNRPLSRDLSITEAEQLLYRFTYDKHQDCVILEEEEKELISKHRRSEFDKRWVEVKRRKKT